MKTSLAPGSRVVTDYLKKAGLDQSARHARLSTRRLRLHDLHRQQRPAAGPDRRGGSGERPRRRLRCSPAIATSKAAINPHVQANYLASPPLVVAYALAGTTDIDLTSEPLGTGSSRASDVFLQGHLAVAAGDRRDHGCSHVSGDVPQGVLHTRPTARRSGRRSRGAAGDLYQWDATSTYIQEPPFFVDMPAEPPPIQQHLRRPLPGQRRRFRARPITSARPARIKKDSPAGKYLLEHGVAPADFNSYGSRRGNDRVMTRGTFANIRLRNLLVPGTEGGVTKYIPTGERMSIYDASLRYQESGIPLDRPRRQGVRDGFVARLGRQGDVPARDQSRHRGKLSNAFTARTWSAWACCRCSSARREPRGTGTRRDRDLRHRPERRSQAAVRQSKSRPVKPTATRSTSSPPAGSTRPSRSNTTATAEFCTRSFGNS